MLLDLHPFYSEAKLQDALYIRVECNTGGILMCVSSYPFQSVTNGKEKFSRLLFCRLKSDCRWTLCTESVRILESSAQDLHH